jgi:hypothetical protein
MFNNNTDVSDFVKEHGRREVDPLAFAVHKAFTAPALMPRKAVKSTSPQSAEVEAQILAASAELVLVTLPGNLLAWLPKRTVNALGGAALTPGFNGKITIDAGRCKTALMRECIGELLKRADAPERQTNY